MVGFDPTRDRFLVSGPADPAVLASRVEGAVLAPRLRRWLEGRRGQGSGR